MKDEDALRGDTIGDTAYSERFVLNVLLRLSSMESITEDFIEKDACLLWDMTVEKDVVDFLLKYDAINIFHGAIKQADDNRLIEISIGCIANMCCQIETVDCLREKPAVLNDIMSYVTSEDSLIVVQALRLIYSAFYYNRAKFDFWIKFLDENNFAESVEFIMENSLNKPLLKQALETLNCICAGFDDNCDRNLFSKQFITDKIVLSTLTAFRELNREYDDDERPRLVFLAIHSIISSFDDSPEVYEDASERLFDFVREIISDAHSNMSDSISDIIEYTTAIVSAFNFPDTEIITAISTKIIESWIQACDAGDFEDADVKPAAVQYFVRVFKLWTFLKIESLFKSVDVGHIENLSKLVDESLDDKSVNEKFGDVRTVIDKLIQNKKKSN